MLITNFGFSQSFPNPPHLALLKARAINGPFKVLNDAFTNSPSEYSEMNRKANVFRSNVLKTGSTADETVQIWKGYPGTVIDPADNSMQYPRTLGEGVHSCAMRFALFGDTNDRNAVRTNLLYQATLPIEAGFVGAHVSQLPAPPLNNNGSSRPSSFSFQNECNWLQNLGQTYILTKSGFSPSQQATWESWYRGLVNYYMSVLNTRITASIPNYLNLDLSVRTGVFADNYEYQYGTKVLYYTSTGIAGPVNTTAGQIFGNVYATYAGTSALAYNILGDSLYLKTTRAFYNAWLFFSVYPDGTLAESVRNGDYNNPAQGAVWYAGLVLNNLLFAEINLRTRNKTLLNITQTGGLPTTKCGVGQSAKDLPLVLNRYLTYHTFSDPRYDIMPAVDSNAIKSPYTGPKRKATDDYCTWYISIYGMAYAIYGNPVYKNAAMANITGMILLPLRGHSAAASSPRAFNEPSNARQPGTYFVWANLETYNIYPNPLVSNVMSLSLSTRQNPVSNTPAVRINATGPFNMTYQWSRISGTSVWKITELTGNSTTLQSTSGSNLPKGTYRVQCKGTVGATSISTHIDIQIQ